VFRVVLSNRTSLDLNKIAAVRMKSLIISVLLLAAVIALTEARGGRRRPGGRGPKPGRGPKCEKTHTLSDGQSVEIADDHYGGRGRNAKNKKCTYNFIAKGMLYFEMTCDQFRFSGGCRRNHMYIPAVDAEFCQDDNPEGGTDEPREEVTIITKGKNYEFKCTVTAHADHPDGGHGGDYYGSGGDYYGSGGYSYGSGGDYYGSGGMSGPWPPRPPRPTARPTARPTHKPTAKPPVTKPPNTVAPPSGECCAKYTSSILRIVGGTTVKRGEFPWQAALLERGQQQCGGTLVSARWVVTANHCVPKGQQQASITKVTLGDHDITKPDGETTYNVEKIVMYPNPSGNDQIDDIALLKLDRAVTFTDKIKPACLPFNYANDKFEGKNVWITGWGSASTVHAQNTPDTLQKIFVPVVTNQQCKRVYGNQAVRDTNICFNSPGKSACSGDSGGPAVWVNPTTSHAFLVGVTSFGDEMCNSGNQLTYGVFTRVTSYLKWIENNIKADGICKV